MSRSEEIEVLHRHLFESIENLSDFMELEDYTISTIYKRMDNIKSNVDEFFKLKDELQKES